MNSQMSTMEKIMNVKSFISIVKLISATLSSCPNYAWEIKQFRETRVQSATDFFVCVLCERLHTTVGESLTLLLMYRFLSQPRLLDTVKRLNDSSLFPFQIICKIFVNLFRIQGCSSQWKRWKGRKGFMALPVYPSVVCELTRFCCPSVEDVPESCLCLPH